MKVEDRFLTLLLDCKETISLLACLLVDALCRLGSLRDLPKVPPLMTKFHVFG